MPLLKPSGTSLKSGGSIRFQLSVKDDRTPVPEQIPDPGNRFGRLGADVARSDSQASNRGLRHEAVVGHRRVWAEVDECISCSDQSNIRVWSELQRFVEADLKNWSMDKLGHFLREEALTILPKWPCLFDIRFSMYVYGNVYTEHLHRSQIRCLVLSVIRA